MRSRIGYMTDTKSKACSKCKVIKANTEFHKFKDYRYGGVEKLASHCKDCVREYTRSYYLQNKHLFDKNKIENRRIKRIYGITNQEIKAILNKQSNKCAICNISFDNTRYHVDHDHQTGKIRGLLCKTCNGGIGYLKDSIEILNNAINYLKQHA